MKDDNSGIVLVLLVAFYGFLWWVSWRFNKNMRRKEMDKAD